MKKPVLLTRLCFKATKQNFRENVALGIRYCCPRVHKTVYRTDSKPVTACHGVGESTAATQGPCNLEEGQHDKGMPQASWY